MNKEINIELIERYLTGQMSETELATFKKEMAENRELAAQVRLIENVDTVLSDEQGISLQHNLQEISKDYFGEEQSTAPVIKPAAKVFSLNRRSWAIAASILFILAAGTLIWQINGGGASFSNEELFAQYYAAEDLSPALRSESIKDSVYQLAIAAYQQKKYDDAIRELSTLQQSDPENKQIAYALGNAFLSNNDPVSAREQFEKITREGKSIFAPNAEWYLVLIDLKEGKTEEAKQRLEKLQKAEDGQLRNQATELLEKLDR